MLDGKELLKNETNCYNCGCNLKPVCPEYEKPKMKIRVTRTHDDAKLPVRAHPTDAGMDLFFCPTPKPELDSKTSQASLPSGVCLWERALSIEGTQEKSLLTFTTLLIAIKRFMLDRK